MANTRRAQAELPRDGWRLDRAVLIHADTCPDKRALEFENQVITYGDLANRVARTATLLTTRVGRGDRFAVYSMNHPEIFVLLLAASRIGAIMMLINWRLTPAEITYQIQDCQPKWVFFSSDFENTARAIANNISGLALMTVDEIMIAREGLRPLEDNEGQDAPDANEDILIVYTSGTTGRPKGAVLSQRALRSNAVMSHDAFDMNSDDIVLNVLPLFHVGGLNIQPLPALILGASVVIHSTFNPENVLATIYNSAITQITTVPTILGALLIHPKWATTNLRSMRMVAIGSTDVPVTIIKAVHMRGIPLIQIYGATETSPTAIYQRANFAFNSVGSIGRVGCDCDVRLVGPDGHDVPEGHVGEIWVKGDNILTHYWNNEAASCQAITEGWFHTGDLARRDAKGLFWFADRLKHVIISGGENIYPAELERVLAGHPDLIEFAIIGRDDERWGQVPMVVAVRVSSDVEAAHILDVFNGEVARFKQPKDLIFVDALPRNAIGKIVIDEIKKLL